jgi:hypothetical protein
MQADLSNMVGRCASCLDWEEPVVDWNPYGWCSTTSSLLKVTGGNDTDLLATLPEFGCVAWRDRRTALVQNMADVAELAGWHAAVVRLCPYVQEDGTCGHERNHTPECHEGACPLEPQREVTSPLFDDERLLDHLPEYEEAFRRA